MDRAAQIVPVAVAAIGALALLARAVSARSDPWWTRWPATLAATLVVLGLLGQDSVVMGLGAAALLVALGVQVVWSYRVGRYLERDAADLWRILSRRPAARQRGRRRRAADVADSPTTTRRSRHRAPDPEL